MAYFHKNAMDVTRKQPVKEILDNSVTEQDVHMSVREYVESEYDDGFDDPEEQAEVQISEEEQKEIQKRRYRMLSGAGNLTAVIAGTVVILILLALLMSMIGFVLNDAERNFTLLQTKF